MYLFFAIPFFDFFIIYFKPVLYGNFLLNGYFPLTLIFSLCYNQRNFSIYHKAETANSFLGFRHTVTLYALVREKTTFQIKEGLHGGKKAREKQRHTAFSGLFI